MHNLIRLDLTNTIYIVWLSYRLLATSLKTKSVIQRRLEFLKAVRFGRYILNDVVRWASYEGLHGVCAAYLFLGKSLEIKSLVQRRLEFLKAVRFGRYVLEDLVCWLT